MSIQSTTHLNVDFYDKKYIMVNAKQYDNSSRWITITCYDQGKIFNLSASKHSAYIRYRKADGYGVLNCCRINNRGEVLVELTEQMLAADGICYVDLLIVNKGQARINVDTGEIINIDDSVIMSTMAFQVNVYEATVDNSLFESSYEYDALNEALIKSEADYKEVIQLARSYAMGDANDIRENEDFDNSKYYSQLSRSYAIGDADGVRENEDSDNSKYYSERSSDSADKSESYAVGGTGTRDGEDTDNAEYYSRLSKSYAMGSLEGDTGTRSDEGSKNAKTYMDNSETYSIASKRYAVGGTNTVDGEDVDNAKYYSEQSLESANDSSDSADLSKSYAVGDTGVRDGENEDNSKYYSEQSANSAIESENYMNYASASADSAHASELKASSSATSASNSATSALESASSASTSEANALTSENNALASASNALISASSASDSAVIATDSATNASASATSAAESAENALESENIVKGYVSSVESSATSASNSATSASESANEAHAYYLQVEEITTGLSGAFMPKGTVEFAELVTLLESDEVKAGELYNISDDFITNDMFKRGAGIEYAAGTNVYMTSDGKLDCLASTTVTGVKGENETEYRKGNVNITVENIGAISIDNIATVDDVKSYLGI